MKTTFWERRKFFNDYGSRINERKANLPPNGMIVTCPCCGYRTTSSETDDHLRLLDWLTTQECTHVAIESTGVYWRPIFNILEGSLEVILVNADHVKAVPGTKTDIKHCEWLADLLRHGLLRASFIPPLCIRELRELTRWRQSLIGERTAEEVQNAA